MAGLSNAKRIRLGTLKEGESKKRDLWFTSPWGAKLPVHPLPAPKLENRLGLYPHPKRRHRIDAMTEKSKMPRLGGTGAKPTRFEWGGGGSQNNFMRMGSIMRRPHAMKRGSFIHLMEPRQFMKHDGFHTPMSLFNFRSDEHRGARQKKAALAKAGYRPCFSKPGLAVLRADVDCAYGIYS
jgi:hypothetical protein